MKIGVAFRRRRFSIPKRFGRRSLKTRERKRKRRDR